MVENPRLLCVGALTQDTIFRFDRLPSKPGKFLPIEAVQTAGGMAASAATAARRQGAEVSLWASVGDDDVGQTLIEQMRLEGIDCSLIRQVQGGRSAIAAILVEASGESLIVPFYDPKTHAAPDRAPIDFTMFDAVLVDTRWPGAAAIALAEAQRFGAPAILDADVAPKHVLQSLLPLASHIIASYPASQLLFDDPVAAREAAERMRDLYGVFAAVTNGSEGTFLSAPDKSTIHVQAYDVDAVDTLAAGDVFHGAFAARFAESGNEQDAIAFASAAAAIKCLRFGGRLGAPTRTETLKFIEERAASPPKTSA